MTRADIYQRLAPAASYHISRFQGWLDCEVGLLLLPFRLLATILTILEEGIQ